MIVTAGKKDGSWKLARMENTEKTTSTIRASDELLSELEKSRLLKIINELGLEMAPDQLDPLFVAVNEIFC